MFLSICTWCFYWHNKQEYHTFCDKSPYRELYITVVNINFENRDMKGRATLRVKWWRGEVMKNLWAAVVPDEVREDEGSEGRHARPVLPSVVFRHRRHLGRIPLAPDGPVRAARVTDTRKQRGRDTALSDTQKSTATGHLGLQLGLGSSILTVVIRRVSEWTLQAIFCILLPQNSLLQRN